MIWILSVMLLILLVAGAIVVYVAYPHRGESVPGAPWLGEALKRGVDAVPVLDAERRGGAWVPSQDMRLLTHPDEAPTAPLGPDTPADGLGAPQV